MGSRVRHPPAVATSDAGDRREVSLILKISDRYQGTNPFKQYEKTFRLSLKFPEIPEIRP
jgi:hypothetical protein